MAVPTGPEQTSDIHAGVPTENTTSTARTQDSAGSLDTGFVGVFTHSGTFPDRRRQRRSGILCNYCRAAHASWLSTAGSLACCTTCLLSIGNLLGPSSQKAFVHWRNLR